MSSGTTLKEIQRFFEYLKQSKTNNEMTILISNSMCKDLQFMVENLCNYRDLLEKRIDKAIEILHDDNYCHIEKLQKINEILGDKENENNNI